MVRYRFDSELSRVVIDARSNVHPIHTESAGLEGWIDLDVADRRISPAQPARGHIEFPVDRLRSGNPLEDRELRRRIDARGYPTIAGDLESSRDDGGRCLVAGSVTFRGESRRYEDHVTIKRKSASTVTLTGEAVFDIRDFGMQPPRILMFKVDPLVSVRIDVVARRETERRVS